jgi:hypothetical protein
MRSEEPAKSGELVAHAAEPQTVPHHRLVAGDDRLAKIAFERGDDGDRADRGAAQEIGVGLLVLVGDREAI